MNEYLNIKCNIVKPYIFIYEKLFNYINCILNKSLIT